MADSTIFVSVEASVAGVSKNHLTIWNGAGSGKTLRIRSVQAAGAPTAAVTGLVIALTVWRITTEPTGGTVLTGSRAHKIPADVPPAQIVARAGATGGATKEPSFFGCGTVSGEETAAPHVAVLYEAKLDGAKPIILLEGEGIVVVQGALASAGAVNIVVGFTVP